jgi:hypothetical protein
MIRHTRSDRVMKHSVVEPLQQAIHELPTIPTPNLRVPDLHVPSAVVEYLPERFRPEKPSHTGRNVLIALVLLAAAVAVMRVVRDRRRSHDDIASYNGSTSSRSSDAPFADVR